MLIWLQKVVVLLISVMFSNVLTYPNPVSRLPSSILFEASNDTEGVDQNNEINPEISNSTSIMEILSETEEEEISRDWLIPEFLGKILPSTSFFTSSQTEEMKNLHGAPNNNSLSPSSSSSSSSFGFLSRLFPNIIIGRPSIFRVQFYNSDFEDGSLPDGDNSTEPKAVFGSPLCLGLCVPVQVFSENTSLHFLSDKQISLFPPPPSPPPPDPTPLVLTTAAENDAKMNLQIDQHPSEESSLSKTNEDSTGTFSWLSSWIPVAPLLSQLQTILPLPEFPKLSSSVSSLVGVK